MGTDIFPSLQRTFGGIPQIVHQHMKYFTYDEFSEEFSCILCDKVIQKQSPMTLEAHLNSAYHREKSQTLEEVIQALTKTFPGKIPQIVYNNKDVLDVSEGGYECVICEKIIKVSSDPSISVSNFSYHLTSVHHEKKLKTHREGIFQLNDVYGNIPVVISNNKDFLQLDKFGKNFVCTLCNVLLKVYKNNMERTEDEFEQHFCSSQHIWGVKWSEVCSVIPEIKKLTVHTYLMRNIDYISNNGVDLFCSLCHENIKRNPKNVNETEENLKHHIFSPTHEGNMFGRQNEHHVKLANFCDVIGVFTDSVLMNLRYLEQINDSYIKCSICDEEFEMESDCGEVNDSIILHLESDFHENNVAEEDSRRQNVIESLENEFGKVPLAIEENLKYIEFVKRNIFLCTLCEVSVSWQNLEAHLSGNRHTQARENKEDLFYENLEQLIGQDYENEIPLCINNNVSHLEYDSISGNFCCTLCDETILVDEGSKREEITLQSFKRHLLSAEHFAKLKEKATKQMKTCEKLESFFGGIPKCILSNIHVLYEGYEDYCFQCDICEVEIQLESCPETSAQNFLQHLRGSRHKSNIKDMETDIDDAFKFLHEKYSVPECLLRDIDFWDNSDDSYLCCALCQQEITVDLDDLQETRWILECHLNSAWHKINLNKL